MATIGVSGRVSAPIAVQVAESLEDSESPLLPRSDCFMYRVTHAVAGAHTADLLEYPSDGYCPAELLDAGVPRTCQLLLHGPPTIRTTRHVLLSGTPHDRDAVATPEAGAEAFFLPESNTTPEPRKSG